MKQDRSRVVEWIPLIGVGVTLLLALCAALIGWYGFRARTESSPKRLDELYAALNAHKLHVSETYVRREDLRELDGRIERRFEELRVFIRDFFGKGS